MAALDVAIASAAEGGGFAEAATRLHAISGDAAFALKLLEEYADK